MMLTTFLTTATAETNELIEKYMNWVKSLDIYRDIGLKLPSPLNNAEFFGIALIAIGLIFAIILTNIVSGILDSIRDAKYRRDAKKRKREHDRKMQEYEAKREEREARREERELRMEEKQDKRFEQQMQAQMQAQEMMNLYTQFMVAAKLQNIPSLMDMSYDKWLVMYNAQQARQSSTQQTPNVIYQGTTGDYVDVEVYDVPKETPVEEPKVVKAKPEKTPKPEKTKREHPLKGMFVKKPAAKVAEPDPVVEEPVVEPTPAPVEPEATVEKPTVIPTDIYEDEPETLVIVPDKEEDEEPVVVVEDKPEPAKVYIIPDDEEPEIVDIPVYAEEEPEEEPEPEAVPEPVDTSEVEEDNEDLSNMDAEDAFAMLLRSIQAEETKKKSFNKAQVKKENERNETLSQLNDETIKRSAEVKVLNSSDEIEKQKAKARLAQEKERAKEEAKKNKKKK